MQSFSEKIIFFWESADLAMSWHAPCLPKRGRENTPSFLPDPLSLIPDHSPLVLKTVHPPPPPTFSLCTPSPLKKSDFLVNPHNKVKIN